jgi:hypothetical protein
MFFTLHQYAAECRLFAFGSCTGPHVCGEFPWRAVFFITGWKMVIEQSEMERQIGQVHFLALVNIVRFVNNRNIRLRVFLLSIAETNSSVRYIRGMCARLRQIGFRA